jgi:hypothetical protein
VVKILSIANTPVQNAVRVFQDPEQTSKWNPHVGKVARLSGGYQLQTYSSPWPFASREYLVRCTDAKLVEDGHATHCLSSPTHPEAPMRSDRVRGESETKWVFTALPGDRTSIHFEGLIDPNGPPGKKGSGGLPKWAISEILPRTSVAIVAGLSHLFD